jgi:hypothetical protein
VGNRASHLSVAFLLAAGMAGLLVAASWINGIKTLMCDEGVAGPSGWTYAGLLLFGLGIVVVGCLGAVLTEAKLRIQYVYVAVSIAEGVTAVVFVAWLSGKYGHYHCG